MKKTEYDQKVAEKTSEIQEKIDVVHAQIIDKQNAYIEFIKVCFRIHDHKIQVIWLVSYNSQLSYLKP